MVEPSAWAADQPLPTHSSRSPRPSAGTSPAYEAAQALVQEYFTGSDDAAYVVVRGITMPVESTEFADKLRTAYLRKAGKPASPQEISSCIETLAAICRTSGIVHPVFNRLGASDDRKTLYLDLANAEGEVVQITRNGWETVRGPLDVRFLHPRGQMPLPRPVRDPGMSACQLIAPFVNLTGDALILYVSSPFGALMPHGPYPVTVITGEQGSGKTTATEVLKRILDPTRTLHRSVPKCPQDVAISASREWILAYNNLSAVPPWLSDLLCNINSGGTYSTRTLYTNAGESSITVARPVVLNGIGDLVVRGGLLDRSILVKLGRFDSGRTTEREYWQLFDTARPAILAALLDAAVCALRNQETSRSQVTDLPRMADFAQWVAWGEEALGFERGSFMRAYAENRSSGSEVAMDEQNQLVDLLERFVSPDSDWKGTTTELHTELKKLAVSESNAHAAPGWFPRNARVLSNTLERLQPDLERTRGIHVARHRSNRGRIIELHRERQTP